jgi:hypothetical protein
LFEQWESSEILKDITYLEIIQIALAVMWWGNLLHEKKINFHVANIISNPNIIHKL